jgi:hypothetical protein
MILIVYLVYDNISSHGGMSRGRCTYSALGAQASSRNKKILLKNPPLD